MSKKNNKDKEEELKETVPTKEEQKEIEKLVEKEDKKETTASIKLENEANLSIPYSDLGYTVSQISGWPEHKRIAQLGAEKAKEMEKKYHL